MSSSKLTDPRGTQRGRRSTYKIEYADIAARMFLSGATIYDVAIELGIHHSTLYLWRDRFPSFAEALNTPRRNANARVVESLYGRATGFEVVMDKRVKTKDDNGNEVTRWMPEIVYYPPDVTAAIFWLKNRDPANWRDVKTLDGDMSITVERGDTEIAMAMMNMVLDAQRRANGQNIEGEVIKATGSERPPALDDGGQHVRETVEAVGAGDSPREEVAAKHGQPLKRRR